MSEVMPFEFQPAPWMAQGACRGGEVNITSLFFPDIGENAEQAKVICNGTLGKTLKNGRVIEARPPCPVKNECLEFALNHPVRLHGIWGGASERERRAINMTTKPGQPRVRPVGVKIRPAKERRHIPPHGSVARYKLERSVTGDPCDDCTRAYERQQAARAEYPELAEVVRLISEVHGTAED